MEQVNSTGWEARLLIARSCLANPSYPVAFFQSAPSAPFMDMSRYLRPLSTNLLQSSGSSRRTPLVAIVGVIDGYLSLM